MKTPSRVDSGLLLLAALGLAFLPDWSQWPGKDLIAKGEAWIDGISQVPKPVFPRAEIVLPVATQANAELSEATPADDTGGCADGAVVDTKPATLKSATGLGESRHLRSLRAAFCIWRPLDDSWVEVMDGAGKVQIQRVMKKGDVMDFSATPPYSVVLGRTDAVEVQVRGQAFDVAPFARNSVARFQVK